MKKSYEMDMCNGPILSKVLVYAFPLMLSGILQLLFNAADVIMTTKKIDVTDPILLEWCVTALRILRGDAEDEL